MCDYTVFSKIRIYLSKYRILFANSGVYSNFVQLKYDSK